MVSWRWQKPDWLLRLRHGRTARNKLLLGAAAFLLLLVFVPAFIFLRFSADKEELTPKYANAASQFINLENGAVVHIRDEGNARGPVLVMIHGANASLQTWEPWVARLGGRFRLISMDLPGHGLTGAVPDGDYSLTAMVDFVHAVSRKLQLARFALAGHDMGGAVAAQYAADYHGQIMALVLLDAAGLPDPDGKASRGFLAGLQTFPLPNWLLSRLDPRCFVEGGLKRAFFDPSKVTDEMADRYADLLSYDGNRKAMLKRTKQMPLAALDLSEALARISAPTLILWGAEDRLAPAARGEALQSHIKAARFIVYPETGHLPMEEASMRSAADLRNFLETQISAEAVAGSYGAEAVDDGSGMSLIPALRGGKGAIEVTPLPAH